MNNIKTELFVSSIKAMQAEVHANAKAKGWHVRNSPCSIVLCRDLLLVITEISEATEALRIGYRIPGTLPGFTAVEEEIADAVIRILELSEFHGLRLAEAIVAKH
ncbi:hypothetical protein SDC9_192661 [bioreactor metagenome]|uniref:Uncharacterized protein n=1 Tax=bioreactor metagenome TaxID=1076179 RepID=A0A645I9V2_9ZZZZ